MTLKLNSKAPAFNLPTETGELLALKDIKEDFIVLFFYPKDDTPGCTLEAIEFTKAQKDFKKLKTKVVGISGLNVKSKQKFCEKHDLGVTLLSDEKFEVAEKYNVYGEKKFMGRTYMGIHRTTFIIDADKKIAHVFEGVKPEGHVEEVLEKIKMLRTK